MSFIPWPIRFAAGTAALVVLFVFYDLFEKLEAFLVLFGPVLGAAVALGLIDSATRDAIVEGTFVNDVYNRAKSRVSDLRAADVAAPQPVVASASSPTPTDVIDA